jgi:hypothetical protein
MSPRRRLVSGIAVALALVLVLALAHHAVAKFVLSRGLSAAVGYDVRFGDMSLGWSHATFTDLHVRKNGDPVLDANRVDVDYALRDIFPGGKHRYGFAGIAIDRPTLTLLRHADGSYNFNRGGSSSSPPAPAQAAAEPLLFSARVRDGTIRVIDAAPLVPDLAEQSIVDVSIDASVQSNARTVARVDGVLVARRTENAPVRRWPLSERSVIDYTRGFAMHRFRAAQLPLRGLLNFLVHDKIARFDDGVMDDLDVRAYALNIDAAKPFAYSLGGGGTLAGAQIALGPLAKPVRDLRGPVDLFDDGVTSPELRATAAGVPLRIRGGMYDFADVHFRLGIEADPQIAQLRTLFTFLNAQPVRGPMHIETLVTATSRAPLIRTVISSPRMYYDKIPLDHAAGTVDYSAGAVSFSGFHTGFGALAATLDGEVAVDRPIGELEGVVHVAGPAADLPYAQTIAAGETIRGDAIVGGNGVTGFRARGTIDAAGPHGSGAGFLTADEHGNGEFGPFLFTRDDGSVLAGGFRLDRPLSLSAGWAVADHYLISVPDRNAVLPGVSIIGFPPIGGIVDTALVAGGPPSDFAVAGHVNMRNARFQRVPLGTLSADLGGTFADMRMHGIHMDGPRGRFRGDGAVTRGVFAVRGSYDGSLPELQAFTGDIDARGHVNAPMAALVDERGVTVQTTGAALAGGSIHGVALGAAAGTMTIDGSAIRIITGAATLDGAHAVAAARDGETAISMVGVPAAAFAGSGLPLDAGRVSVFGLGDFSQPSFHGSIDLDRGRALGYPIGGWVDIGFTGRTLQIHDGIAALGQTYGRLGGRIDDIGEPGFHYDLNAGVGLGDLGSLISDLHLPLRYADGSFAAHVRISGGATGPAVNGAVEAPEGSYNGLAFRDARGLLSVSPAAGIRFDDGRVTVGSTRATFGASIGGRALGIQVASQAANLADFDGYFDTSEMLAGTGELTFNFTNDGVHTTSSGQIDLTGARVRRFPLGTVDAQWSTGRAGIAADLSIAGAAGGMHAAGTIAPAAGGPLTALLRAHYTAAISGTGVDLGTYLPAAGFTYPILGRVTAAGQVAGVFPQLVIGGHATVADGQIGPFPVTSAEATTHVENGRISIDSASADLGFVQLTAGGLVGWGRADPLSLHVHASVPDLTVAARRISPHKPIDVAGALESDVLISGTLAKPQLTAGFDLTRPRYGQLLVQRIVGDVDSDFHSLKLDSAEFVLNHGSAVIAGSVPFALNPAGLGPPDAPLSVTADAHSVDLAALAPLLPGSGTKLTGTVDGHLEIDGTVRAPRILGSVSLSQGSYVSNLETAPIRNVSAQLAFAGTSVALQALHAQVGAGTIDADGRLNLGFSGAPNEDYAINITAKAAQLNLPSFGSGTIDGTAQLVSGPRFPTLSGDLALTNATIPFAAIFRAAGAPAQAVPGGPPPFDLGLDLTASAQNVRIKSPIIDVGANGNITLTGTLRAPRADGAFTANRGGVFSTYQRLFRIQDATVTFDPSQGIIPNLDLHATAHVDNPDPDPARNAIGSADITVAVTGPANGYTLSYSSQPAYSQAQIIALLVDLPVLGSLNFGATQASTLRGAPGESDAFLPPGVTPYQTGVVPIQQEAFSLFNTQLTQRLVSPLENAFGGALGLTDLELTLDYGARVGYTARQQLSKKRNVYLTFGQVLSYPVRTQIGFASRPDPATTISFSYFQQNGTPYFTNSIFGNTSTVEVVNGVQPLSDRQGFSFVLSRSYR